MKLYDRYILPSLTHCFCGLPALSRLRAAVVPAASGRVLDIGCGSGLNLPYLDPTRIESYTGIDPSRELLAKAPAQIHRLPFEPEWMPVRAESLPLSDSSIDTVLITFTMCTIPDVISALFEIRRILAPDGKVLFLEHGLAPERNVQKWQRRIEPAWRKLAGGCHLTRDIPDLLHASGLHCHELNTGYLRYAPRFASFIYRGAASASGK